MEGQKFLARMNFCHFECVFINRSCNSAALALAALGEECEGGKIIRAPVPSNIQIVSAEASAK
jgi:hypothetical protein